MAVLLTGGSGFIGSHFHLVIPNQEIVNLDILAPSFKNESLYVQGDIRIKEDVIRAISQNKIDCIISLAAKHHDFGIGHDEYFDTNEEGTKVICDVASQFGIKEIIFYSSVAVYGMLDRITSETSEPNPDSPYGASKLAGEKVLIKWALEDPARKLLIIRPTVVFGPGNMANMRNLIRQIDSGLFFHIGKADNIKSIAYVENIAQATLFLKDRLRPGVSIYNYSDEPQLTSREISDEIARSLNKKIRFTLPKLVGVMLGLPFDLIIYLTGKNLPVSSSRIKKLATATHHSAKKIFSEGFKPNYSTKEGLQRMVAWYRATEK
jgi:GlcNAc-P-P-Und epimerase